MKQLSLVFLVFLGHHALAIPNSLPNKNEGVNILTTEKNKQQNPLINTSPDKNFNDRVIQTEKNRHKKPLLNTSPEKNFNDRALPIEKIKKQKPLLNTSPEKNFYDRALPTERNEHKKPLINTSTEKNIYDRALTTEKNKQQKPLLNISPEKNIYGRDLPTDMHKHKKITLNSSSEKNLHDQVKFAEKNSSREIRQSNNENFYDRALRNEKNKHQRPLLNLSPDKNFYDRALPTEIDKKPQFILNSSPDKNLNDQDEIAEKDTSGNIRQSCGGSIYAHSSSSGSIYYGTSSGFYPNNARCTWRIYAPTSLTISFSRFDTEPSYDYLYIRDGTSSSSTLLRTLHGNSVPSAVTTSNNGAYLYFTSDGSTTKSGFYLNWRWSCGFISTSNSGTIQYPSSGNYGNNENCNWIIRPSSPIKFTFSRFSTESYHDRLSIRDGRSSGSHLLATLSGTSVPCTISTSTSGAYLNFRSDGSVVNTGFTLSWGPAGCGAAYNSTTGMIRHPLSGNYISNQVCTWKIRTSEPIIITFSRFNTENGYDHLYIGDGENIGSNLLGNFSGSSVPSEVNTTTDTAYLHFRSDGSSVRTGFELSWRLSAPTTTAAISTTLAPSTTAAGSTTSSIGSGNSSTTAYPTATTTFPTTPAPTTTAAVSTTLAPSTTVSVSTTTSIGSVCRPKTKCSKKGGYCTSSADNCNGKTTTGCYCRNCVCCLRRDRCRPNQKCLKKGGFCVTDRNSCSGKIINNGCQSGNCYCCVKQPKC